MQDSLALIAVTSLKIFFMYVAMKEGMIFHIIPRLFEKLWAALPAKNWALTLACYARKPLYGCSICMASIWGTIFTISRFSLTWDYLLFLFAVGGLNYIIDSLIAKSKDEGKEN
jgi:hypothetical protein